MVNAKKKRGLRERLGDRVFYGVCMAMITLMGVACLYPYLNLVAKSLSGSAAVSAGRVLGVWPIDFTLSSYAYVLHSARFTRAIGFTALITVVGTVLNLALTVFVAYAVSRRDMPGSRVIMLGYLITMLFGGGMIPTFLVVQGLGMVDTFWALIIPGLMSAYNMFILRNYFQQLPPELEESAYIDGATPPVALLFIILPISAPSLAAIAMFYAVGNWNSYLDCLLYTNSGDLQVLQIYLRNLIDSAGAMDSIASISGKETSQLSAETVKMTTIAVSIIPILIIYPFLQRFYTKGITVGAVKG